MAVHGGLPPGDGLSDLFEASPEFPAHTSVAAELALLLGLVALLASPFSVMFAVSWGLATLALFSGLVGLASTSRRGIAGGSFVPIAMTCSVITVALLGLRYVGVDTAFGDNLLPQLLEALEYLNSLLPMPG